MRSVLKIVGFLLLVYILYLWVFELIQYDALAYYSHEPTKVLWLVVSLFLLTGILIFVRMAGAWQSTGVCKVLGTLAGFTLVGVGLLYIYFGLCLLTEGLRQPYSVGSAGWGAPSTLLAIGILVVVCGCFVGYSSFRE